MSDKKTLPETLKAIADQYRAGGPTYKLLEANKQLLKELCDLKVPLKVMLEALKEYGYKGNLDGLAVWLDKTGLRKRPKRSPKIKKTQE